jgi:enterochelin esterase-like enzyme
MMLLPTLVAAALAAQISFAGPDVSRDHTVVLSVAAPLATAVRLWGDWMTAEAGVPMTRGADGVWTAVTPALSPGPHLYAFFVDGLRVADPANRRVKNGYPGVSSVLDVPGEGAVSDARGVTHIHTYVNGETGRVRSLHVYTPAGFSAATRLPVVYLLHGSTDTDRDWTRLGQAGEILERLVRDGTARPMLLVMPDGHPYTSLDVSTRAANLRLLDDEIVQTIAPLVERVYHPASGAATRAIAGASMGGAQALHLAARHPGMFGTVVGFSAPGDIPSGPMLVDAWRGHPRDRQPGVWLFCGAADPFLAEARLVRDQLQKLGQRVDWTETSGAHDWPTWRGHLESALRRLFR